MSTELETEKGRVTRDGIYEQPLRSSRRQPIDEFLLQRARIQEHQSQGTRHV